jgi:hypothetical protein
MKNRATVALVDWNWGGHNHTYFKHYIAGLLKGGVDVLPVMSQPDLIDGMVGSPELAPFRNGPASVVSPIGFSPSRPMRIRPARLAGYFSGVTQYLAIELTFRRLAVLLRNWEKASGKTVDLVFFACMIDVDFPSAIQVSRALGKRWSGLYLQGRAFHRMQGASESKRKQKAKVLFGSRRLVALGTLEPAILELVRAAIPDLKVRLFPDTLEPVDAMEAEPAKRMRATMLEKAGGRPIVSLLGFLQPSKGVELFLKAACDPRLVDLSFFLGGPMQWHAFDESSRARVEKSMRLAPNLQTHLEQLPEQLFNAAVGCSDVLVAAYRSFPYSSNVQVKAAQFHKPMIVTDGTLMAERCREYRLGETIREGDLESLVQAIRRLVSTAEARRQDPAVMNLHDQFAAMNSPAAVYEAMKWVLESAGIRQRL